MFDTGLIERLNNRVTEAMQAGMTEKEAESWALVGTAAGSCLKMDKENKLHPMDQEELCHAFHAIQNLLLGRPVLRELQEIWEEDDGVG